MAEVPQPSTGFHGFPLWVSSRDPAISCIPLDVLKELCRYSWFLGLFPRSSFHFPTPLFLSHEDLQHGCSMICVLWPILLNKWPNSGQSTSCARHPRGTFDRSSPIADGMILIRLITMRSYVRSWPIPLWPIFQNSRFSCLSRSVLCVLVVANQKGCDFSVSRL